LALYFHFFFFESTVVFFKDMMRRIRTIPLLFVVMILAGVFSSTLHVHGDLFHGNDRAEIIEDHNYCSICAYHFQYSHSAPNSADHTGFEASFISPDTQPVFEKPLLRHKNKRAPPVQA
jgi:hypothetical protein